MQFLTVSVNSQTKRIPRENMKVILTTFKSLLYFFFFFGCVGSSLLHVGFSLVAASRGYSSLPCAGFSLQRRLLLRSMGSRRGGFSSCGTWALERRLSSCS